MNGNIETQLQLDFRTGRPTFIHGKRLSERERQACATLNRQRSGGIAATARQSASGQPLSIDVWTSLVAREAEKLEVPLIPLSAFGLSFDSEGFMHSNLLERLGTGAEATAWKDARYGCVYKLFDLKRNGALGKKLEVHSEGPYNSRVSPSDAELRETLEKLSVLHEAGACPTEIVGLADTGDYLIIKQPLCFPYGPDFHADRNVAVEILKAVLPHGSYGSTVWVFWAAGKPWCLGDLHKGNIMRGMDGKPTIIDALIGPLSPAILRAEPALDWAVSKAHALREGRKPVVDDISHGVSDDEL